MPAQGENLLLPGREDLDSYKIYVTRVTEVSVGYCKATSSATCS